MPTQAQLGIGTKILMGDGATPTEAFTELAELGDFEDSDTVELVETTNHQSAGNRKEYIAGLIDGDEITLPMNYLIADATHDRTTGLQSKLGETVNFRLEEVGNANGYEFAAVVLGSSKSYPVADRMVFTVTLKKTGAATPYVIA